MAKFFRFIVNLCIICFLLTGIALIVPQFLGITTVVVDEAVTDTNLSRGTVVYGKEVPLRKLEVGDKLLRTTNTSVYVSKITAGDAAEGKYTVVGKDGTLEEMTLRRVAEKKLIAIPFIGYVSIAMQSFEGRIILGLAFALLVILFILAELWKKDGEDDSEEEDYEEDDSEEDEAEMTRRERKALKKEKKRNKKESKKRNKKENKKQNRKQNKKRREKQVEEETVEDEVSPLEDSSKEFPSAADELNDAIRELILEPSDEIEEQPETLLEEETQISEEQPEEPQELDEFTAALQAALEGSVSTGAEKTEEAEQKIPAKEEEKAPVSNEPKTMAIPVLTAEQLLEKAITEGDQPKIVEDEEDGITFIDYSEIL